MITINKCPVYNDQLNHTKSAKTNYYKQQIHKYKQEHPTHTADDAFSHFNNGDCKWAKRTFKNYFYNKKVSQNQISMKTKKQYQPKYVPTKQDTTNVIQQLQLILSRLRKRTDTVSVQAKQIILSSIACIDNNGKCTNKDMIRHVYPKIGSRLYQQIVNIKHAYNVSDASLLYNDKTCGSNRTRVVYDETVDGNFSSFLMQIHHKCPCPTCAIIPKTVLLIGFYSNCKPFTGGRRC